MMLLLAFGDGLFDRPAKGDEPAVNVAVFVVDMFSYYYLPSTDRTAARSDRNKRVWVCPRWKGRLSWFVVIGARERKDDQGGRDRKIEKAIVRGDLGVGD